MRRRMDKITRDHTDVDGGSLFVQGGSQTYLDEVDQTVVDMSPLWQEEATSRAQLVEEKQLLLLETFMCDIQ